MVTMLTVVPINMASSLKEKVKIKSYNTLPNIQSSVLEAVKSFMNKRVGYNELPMACLEISGDLTDVDTEDIFHYIPTNCKETVLFQLEMPEDMIISVKYQDLLDASQDAEEFSDDPEFLQDVLDEFTSKLVQGPM